ncbi:MAG TPA: FAD-binding oxidoreductase [Terriglobales bacterium]|nr:FAD-binding oxidoreductase [Terriglobales bacterium]
MGTHSSSHASIVRPSIAAVEAAWSDLRALVGAEHMRTSMLEDTVDDVLPQMFIEPGNPEEVAGALKIATGAGLQVVPRGGATQMGWGNPPRSGDLILSTRRLNRVVEHAWGDMTATVEAGCTFQQLQQTLAEHGQRLALDPLWPDQATIGGILATNESGPLRVRFGGLRDLIIGITLALPDGTLAKSGGKVVKNVAGYDLPKLATGSLGTLGIITQAIFRLHPIPRESRTLSFSNTDSGTMNAVVLAIQDCNMVPTGVQVRAGSSSTPEIDLRFEGTAAGCEAQIEQTLRIASGARRIESPADVWNARSTLWSGAEPSVVCKFSLLPAELGTFLTLIRKSSEPLQLPWRLVAQAVGVGYLRLEGNDTGALLSVLQDLRKNLETRGGSLVILRCPLEIKSKMDVWGSAGDALALMRSIKAQFDPTGVLNPGRFIGGI